MNTDLLLGSSIGSGTGGVAAGFGSLVAVGLLGFRVPGSDGLLIPLGQSSFFSAVTLCCFTILRSFNNLPNI